MIHNINKIHQKTEVKIMTKIDFLIKVLIACLLLSSNAFPLKTDYFNEGKILFDQKKFEKSKFFFEKDIVFNPKSEKSYLFLAKIFQENGKIEEQEINLNNVLSINPQNDEAVYMLVLLKINQSDYKKAKELIETFNLICKTFCSKKSEMQDKFNKLTPENAKNNN